MKWGIGESYDNVLFNKRFRAYIDVTKPASTVGVVGAYLFASLFYFYYTGVGVPENQLLTILTVVLTIGLAHGSSQAMNMAEDAEMDRKTEHKKNRPIPSGVITEEEARAVSWLTAGLSIGLSFTINVTYGAFIMLLMFFGIFYNLNPIRAKERIISIPWQAVSRGLLSFPAVWAAYGDPLDPLAWVLGLFMFFYVLGFQNSADIIDAEVDSEYGIKTFVVEFGVKRTVMIAAGCTLLMVFTIVGGIAVGILPEYLSSMLLIIPFCMYMLFEMWRNPYKVSDMTGNHPAWLFFYGGMMLSVLIPLVAQIINH